jgi:GNAT superfamily N-acetyltransferase
MLEWAQRRAAEIANAHQNTVSLSLALYEGEEEKRILLEQNGFSLMLEGFDWYMSCDLGAALSEPLLPQRFVLRPVRSNDQNDIRAYERAYGFTPVTSEHRFALLQSTEYCHLVIATPDNSTFAAYCEVSMSREEWAVSGQRVGWIDYVQTGEHFQRQGLGKAITLAGLRQLQLWGADKALLITRSDNVSAQNTFKAARFSYKERDFCYAKVLSQ